MKKFLSLLILISFTFSACSMDSNNSANTDINYTSPSNNLKLTVFNAGKADAMLITINDKNIIIDTGEKGEGTILLNYLKENNISIIDYLIITHFDKDHVGGAAKIINNIKVSNVIQPNYISTSKAFSNYKDALEKAKITPTSLESNISFTIANATFSIYPAQKTSYSVDSDSIDNYMSLVIDIVHEKNRFLLAGDVIKNRLQELIDMDNINSTFLKIPHHGKYEELTQQFLEKVHPTYAAITCSKEKPADKKTLEILNNLKTQTYLTTDGDITVISNGSSIKVTQ